MAANPVRNRIGWRDRLARLRGVPVEVDLRSYDAELMAIGDLEQALRAESDETLSARGRVLRERSRTGVPPDALRVETFAVVRELCRRALGLRPFDEQIVAALALDRGRIIDMQTGEGKTLAAVMPAAFHALTGNGVHVLTFNDYLARRDAQWMGPVYERLGLIVGVVQERMPPADRRRAYRADITYLTAKEAGFDYLRDQLAMHRDAVVHRPFHFAVIDEADSIMIDEARAPLVIAGQVQTEASAARQIAALVASFTAGNEFSWDEYRRDVELTDAGIERVERALDCGNLHDPVNLPLLTQVNCALHAHALLRRDVDYIVRHGRIEVVDEFTGRAVPDRHWPDGLQAALEAKEGVARAGDGEILGSITLQHFLGLYPKCSGMSGTARAAAGELNDVYGLAVTVIPTHRPMIRIDQPDVIFTHADAKRAALIDEVARTHAAGRPVLVGTLTIEESQRLAEALQSAAIPCEVLNAKNDEAESALVARAGTFGAVTISTNMAGRGTDIKLGAGTADDAARIGSLGGLYVISTNRHESRRVDLQLRGRAGRQGDPGESRAFVSLDDDLLVRYGLGALLPSRWTKAREAGSIDHPVVRSEIGRAQRIIEGQNLEIRKTLSRYAAVVEQQRRILMQRRQRVLETSEDLESWGENAVRRAALVAAAGEEAVRHAEQAVTLFQIDRAWRDHLAFAADLREGIHLVTLAGKDPLTHFTVEVIRAFEAIDARIDAAVMETLTRIDVRSGRIDLEHLGVHGPSSTWTYLVTDDPFKDQLSRLLTGPGRASIAIYSGFVLMPLLMLWTITHRLMKRRRRS